MILDANGNPIPERQIRESQTASLGAIAREFDVHPARGLTPQRLHSILLGGERGDITAQIDLADDIEERDGHVFSELHKRAGAVASLEWSIVEPENPTPAEKTLTDQVRAWFGELGEIDDIVRAMMGAAMRGFSCHEMVWQPQPDGAGRQVLLPEVTFRPQRWFTVDKETRNELRLRRAEKPEGEPLNQFSWIAHVHKTRNGYLARMGLARVLAWPYLYKNFAVRDLAEFLEIYGLPLRVGKYPSGASEEEKRKLLQAVAQIGHNAAGIIPAGMVIDFMEAAQGSEGPYEAMQDRMEAIQSKVILGQTLTSGEGKHGTQALGKVHNEVRKDIRDDDVRQIAGTINRQLIYPLATLNSGSAEPRRLPRIVFDDTEPEDMAAYAESLPKLVALGFKVGPQVGAGKAAHARAGRRRGCARGRAAAGAARRAGRPERAELRCATRWENRCATRWEEAATERPAARRAQGRSRGRRCLRCARHRSRRRLASDAAADDRSDLRRARPCRRSRREPRVVSGAAAAARHADGPLADGRAPGTRHVRGCAGGCCGSGCQREGVSDMKDQHQKIKGYRELSQAEIDLINEVKALAEQCGDYLKKLRTMNGQPNAYGDARLLDQTLAPKLDQRWISIGATDLQRGFMAVIRGIAQPTTF